MAAVGGSFVNGSVETGEKCVASTFFFFFFFGGGSAFNFRGNDRRNGVLTESVEE